VPDLELSRQTVWQSPKVVILSITGEVEASNALQAEQYFDRLIQEDQPRHVLLDLSGLNFANSVFFSSLLFWREELTRRGGQLVVYGLRPEMLSTIRIVALDQILTIRPDQVAALDTLSRRPDTRTAEAQHRPGCNFTRRPGLACL
jgi:anti-anti-sigma factor